MVKARIKELEARVAALEEALKKQSGSKPVEKKPQKKGK